MQNNSLLFNDSLDNFQIEQYTASFHALADALPYETAIIIINICVVYHFADKLMIILRRRTSACVYARCACAQSVCVADGTDAVTMILFHFSNALPLNRFFLAIFFVMCVSYTFFNRIQSARINFKWRNPSECLARHQHHHRSQWICWAKCGRRYRGYLLSMLFHIRRSFSLLSGHIEWLLSSTPLCIS